MNRLKCISGISNKTFFNNARLQGTLSYCFKKFYSRCPVLVRCVKGFTTIASLKEASVVSQPFTARTAFTLAEVLITLAILGLVADMTLPTLMTKVNDRALQTAKQVANLKFEEALNQMRVNEKLTGYNTADDFVKEFKNYIKIVQRCKPDNLTQCFPMTIETATEKIDPSTLKTGANIVPSDKKANFPSNNVGITMPNGIMAILNYDKTCQWMNPFTGATSKRQEAMTCISMVYDVNGRKKPNKVGEDIILLNAKLSSCDGTKIGSLCVEGSNTPITPLDCSTSSSPDAASCPAISGYSEDYWAGATKACKDKQMRLPTQAELAEMATLTYGVPIGAQENKNPASLVDGKDPLNIVNNSYDYWSSEQYAAKHAYVRYFNTTATSWYPNNKNYSGHLARCVR